MDVSTPVTEANSFERVMQFHEEMYEMEQTVDDQHSKLSQDNTRKKRKTAILLAIFGFGWTTWLYTYERDKVKVWIAVILFTLSFGIGVLVFWPWGIIQAIVRTDEFYQSYNQWQKKKWIAVFFAVFGFGWATWSYTYEHDWNKVWFLGFLLPVTFGAALFIIWPYAIIEALHRPASFYEEYKPPMADLAYPKEKKRKLQTA